jgi:acid phosphatase type 7
MKAFSKLPWIAVVLMLVACGGKKDGDNDGGSGPVQDTRAADTMSDIQLVEDSFRQPDIAPEVEPFSCRSPVSDRIVDDNPDLTFDLGPYLMAPTSTAITIMWRTLEEEDGAVLYGFKEAGENITSAQGLTTVHSVRLEGLSPETRYAYQVRSGERTSEVHHFYTAPPPGGSFKFAAWGDNQGGEPFPDVLKVVLNDAPHMVMGLGDHVHDGRIDILWKDHLFDPARALLHEVPWFAAFGNHGKNGKLYYDLMGYENLALSPETESMYSYTYGNAFYLVIDTNGLFFEIAGVDTEWSAWVKEQVASPAAQNATWRFAYAHEPGADEEFSVASPCGGYEGTVNSGIRVFLLPLLQEHDFHAYFAGHVHIYERTMVGSLLHIIAAGGGGGLEYCELESDVSVLANRHHFLRGTIGCDSALFEAVGLDGEVFDWVELAAGAPGVIIGEAAQ